MKGVEIICKIAALILSAALVIPLLALIGEWTSHKETSIINDILTNKHQRE